jgi:peptidoglycan-N-acetylglucosamine deacetylase
MGRKTSVYALVILMALGISACSAQATPTATPTAIPPSATAVPSTPVVFPTAIPQPTVLTATPTVPPTPTDTFTPSPSSTPTVIVYIVKQNDTLFNIASQFHVDVGALTQANQLTNTVLAIGQKLIIPGGEFATATPSPVPSGLPRGYKIQYKVLLGDTLESIAAKFNSTVAEISKANPDPTDPKNIFKHLTNANLQAEIVITVPVNLVTPTSTPGG